MRKEPYLPTQQDYRRSLCCVFSLRCATWPSVCRSQSRYCFLPLHREMILDGRIRLHAHQRRPREPLLAGERTSHPPMKTAEILSSSDRFFHVLLLRTSFRVVPLSPHFILGHCSFVCRRYGTHPARTPRRRNAAILRGGRVRFIRRIQRGWETDVGVTSRHSAVVHRGGLKRRIRQIK